MFTLEKFAEVQKWLRDGFPREMGLYRGLAVSSGDIFTYLISQKYVDCYASLFSYSQIDMKVYDAVFLDIDGSYSDLKKVIDILDREGLPRTVYFSGRGFHVFCYFQPTRIVNYNWRVRQWASEVGLIGEEKLVDVNVLGDARRMVRIPYTINSKTGLYCIPIDEDDDYETILKNASDEHYVKKIKIEYSDLGERLLKYPERQKNVNHVNSEMNDFPPLPLCISKIVDEMIVRRHLEHEKRLLLGTFLLKFMDVQRAAKVFNILDDFSESYTEYQLEWLKKNNYQPFSCKRIKEELKLCNGERCIYYPFIGKKEIWVK